MNIRFQTRIHAGPDAMFLDETAEGLVGQTVDNWEVVAAERITEKEIILTFSGEPTEPVLRNALNSAFVASGNSRGGPVGYTYSSSRGQLSIPIAPLPPEPNTCECDD